MEQILARRLHQVKKRGKDDPYTCLPLPSQFIYILNHFIILPLPLPLSPSPPLSISLSFSSSLSVFLFDFIACIFSLYPPPPPSYQIFIFPSYLQLCSPSGSEMVTCRNCGTPSKYFAHSWKSIFQKWGLSLFFPSHRTISFLQFFALFFLLSLVSSLSPSFPGLLSVYHWLSFSLYLTHPFSPIPSYYIFNDEMIIT